MRPGGPVLSRPLIPPEMRESPRDILAFGQDRAAFLNGREDDERRRARAYERADESLDDLRRMGWRVERLP